ncbi:MAG TPA: hypothetical protein P5307_20290 [Pirellulaceae bacterium]|nr:hypothetical protein [Pirellulaceae bacterium]
MLRRRLFLVCGLCGLCLSGCGGSAEQRLSLRGSITIDGAKLEKGAISLKPVEGHSGPAAVTTVEDGWYRFTTSNGPMPGPYAVKINVDPESGQGKSIIQGPSGSVVAAPSGPKGGSLPPLPKTQRNVAQPKLYWELQYTIPKDGSNKRDFELKS